MERQWEGRTRGGATGYRFFLWLIRHSGLGAAYAFLSVVVLYFIPFAPRQTRSSWVYARKVLGLPVLKSVFFLVRSYYSFGQSMIDRFAAGMGMMGKFSYDFDGHEKALSITGGNLGCVVIGAHIGSWQMGAGFFRKYGAKVNIVMYDNEYQTVKDVVRDNTGPDDYNVIPVSENDFSYLISITSALRKGELVCLQGDRYMKDERVLKGEFMGRTAEFPEGPFLLAARMKCPVLFYFSMREKGRRYRFIFRTPETDGGIALTEEALFASYLKVLEETVRQYPDQWFNYYDFWKLYSKEDG